MSDAAEMPYSIVIAARNEEETLGDVLAKVRPMTDDLLVIDGHSTDQTVAIASSFGARVLQDRGRGKGDALRLGIDNVRHPIVVFLDADGSHDPQDIARLVAPIAADEADLVIGSRMLGGSDELYGSIAEAIRMLGGLIITLTINCRYGTRITDYQNGFRAIRTEVARSLGLTSDLSTIEQEMAMKCLRYGYRIVERPAHEYRRQGGASKINVMRLTPIYLWNLICGLLAPRQNRVVPHSASSSQEPAGQLATEQRASA